MGFLLGKQQVESSWPLRNVSRYPRQAFELDPQEVAEALFQDLPILGLYHSHPGLVGVVPSREDAGGCIPSFWHYWIIGEAGWYRRVFTSDER